MLLDDVDSEPELLLPSRSDLPTLFDLREELPDDLFGFFFSFLSHLLSFSPRLCELVPGTKTFELRVILGDGIANSRYSLFSVSLSLSLSSSPLLRCDEEWKLEIVWVVSWVT